MKRYSRKQAVVLAVCMVGYSAAYVGRTSLAPAMGAMQAYFGVNSAQIGLLPTLYAIPYAAGQAINGLLAERVPPRPAFMTALLGSALMNLLLSMSDSFGVVMLLWCANGCFQSIVWSQILRQMTAAFSAQTQPDAQFCLSFCTITGYLVGWGLSGAMTARWGWRAAFLAAAGVTASLAAITAPLMDGSLPVRGAKRARAAADAEQMPVKALLLQTDFLLILLISIVVGYVRDGVMSWAPQIVSDVRGAGSGGLSGSLGIPVVTFLGIQATRGIYRRMHGRSRFVTVTLAAIGIVFTMLLSLPPVGRSALCTPLLALCAAAASGLSSMLTGIIPLEFRGVGRVTLVSGAADALVYAGSALAGTLVGFIRDGWGWPAVFLSWCAAWLVCAALVKSMRRGVPRDAR